MRQQWHQRIFDRHPPGPCLNSSLRKRLFAVSCQQPVQIGVGAGYGQSSTRRSVLDLIDLAAEDEFATEACRHIAQCFRSAVHEFDTYRVQALRHQLPAQPHNHCDEELDLVAIAQAAHRVVMERYADRVALAVLDQHAFVLNGAIPLGAPQGLAERVGRRLNVVKQTQLAKVYLAGKMKSEKLVRQPFSDQIEKRDLISDGNAKHRIVQLLERYSGAFRQQSGVWQRNNSARIGGSGYSAGRRRYSTDFIRTLICLHFVEPVWRARSNDWRSRSGKGVTPRAI